MSWCQWGFRGLGHRRLKHRNILVTEIHRVYRGIGVQESQESTECAQRCSKAKDCGIIGRLKTLGYAGARKLAWWCIARMLGNALPSPLRKWLESVCCTGGTLVLEPGSGMRSRWQSVLPLATHNLLLGDQVWGDIFHQTHGLESVITF